MKPLIKANNIRRMALPTLQRRREEIEGREDAAATLALIDDEIERRLSETPPERRTLLTRSAVYAMKIRELEEHIVEMWSEANAADPAWRNTINMLEDELSRRKVQAKKTYWRRKLEYAECSTP